MPEVRGDGSVVATAAPREDRTRQSTGRADRRPLNNPGRPRSLGRCQHLINKTRVTRGGGFFLCVDDFDASYQRMHAAGAELLTEPRTAPYGRVVVSDPQIRRAGLVDHHEPVTGGQLGQV